MIENGVDDGKRAFASFPDDKKVFIIVPDIMFYEFHALFIGLGNSKTFLF